MRKITLFTDGSIHKNSSLNLKNPAITFTLENRYINSKIIINKISEKYG